MDENGRNKLWAAFREKRTPQIREQIIIEYSQLVKLVAGRLSMYLGYTVEYEDLVSYGIFGLIDAIDKFDCDKNVKFETYASLRIRGAILDQIRKMDWIPRSVRQKQKRIDAAYSKIETEYGRTATDEELAAEMEISLDEFYAWQGQTKSTNLVSLDEFVEQGSEVKMDAASNSHFEQPEKIVGSGIAVSGMDAEGTATGAVSNGAFSVGAGVPAGEATGAAAGSVGASGTSGGVAAIFGTIGGKIAIGIVGTAMVAAIGVGVHHVVTENQSTTEKTAVSTMGDASENEIITKYTSYEAVLADLKQCIEQGTTYEASENFTDKSKNKDAFYVIDDFDGDGTDELIIGQWNAVIGGMDIGDVFTMRDGNVVKIFTCNYGYGDNGQSAVLYNDGIIYENAEKINFENEQALECKYVYNIRWRIAGGTCNFDIAKITYSADGEGRSAYQIIFIHDEKALSMFDNTVETGFSAVQNLVDSAPEIYIKPTVNEDLGDGLNIYKTSWKTLYDDNSYMNTDSGPKPDADGKF